MRMNTYAYEYFFEVKKLCPHGHSPVCFTYVHAVLFLSRNHAPEGGRGDDEATENSQHTPNTINVVVRASIEISSLLLRRNDDNGVTYSTTLTDIILYTTTYISIQEEHFIED